MARILIDHALVCETVKPYVPKVCRDCDDGPPQAAILSKTPFKRATGFLQASGD